MAVELRNRLGESIGQNLPATLLFEYPTVSNLADYLVDKILLPEMEGKSVVESPVMQTASTDFPGEMAYLEELSENELADLLKAKLRKISPD